MENTFLRHSGECARFWRGQRFKEEVEGEGREALREGEREGGSEQEREGGSEGMREGWREDGKDGERGLIEWLAGSTRALCLVQCCAAETLQRAHGQDEQRSAEHFVCPHSGESAKTHLLHAQNQDG